MTNKVIVTERILEEIGENLRERYNVDAIKAKEFPEYIRNLPKPGDSIAPGEHCDQDGKWHKPDDWDDIESIDLTDKHEVYILCDTQLTAEPYLGLSVVAGNEVYYSYGNIIEGEFVKHQSSTRTKVNINSSKVGIISLTFKNITDRYIVVRIEATDFIGKCASYSVTDKSICATALAGAYGCGIMRYGRMVGDATYGIDLTFKSYFLESDRIIDFGLNARNTTNEVKVINAYSSDYSLQRVKLDNFDLSQNYVTTFEGMFTTCYQLSDLPDPFDLSGFVTSNCTSLKNMFNACFSIKSRLVLNNWDITNVTTMENMFNKCIALPYIDGLTTWTKAASCATYKQMFNWCHSLRTYLDLSNWYIGNAGTPLNSDGVYYMFTQTKSLSGINLNNSNWAPITTTASLFNESSAKELIWDTNFTPPTTVDSTASMFATSTGFKEVIFDGWNFSALTNMGNMFNNSYGIKRIEFKNCTPPTSYADSSSTKVPYTYVLACRYIDLSFLDMRNFTGNYMHTSMLSASQQVVEFYPPQHICKACTCNSPMLSHDSLLRILNNLDTTSSAKKLTLGASNIGRLTDTEKAIATDKGWTLA